jgi:hypothetical protein
MRRTGVGTLLSAVAVVLLQAPVAGYGSGGPIPSPSSVGPSRTHAAAGQRTDFGIQLLEAPQSHLDDPRAYAYIVDHLNPDTTIHRRIRVTNNSDAPVHLDLYAAAASIVDHSFRAAEGREGNELTSWVSVDPNAVDLAGHGRADAHITVAVPGNASKGEQYAVVWAQDAPDVDTTANVAMVTRVGIRIYLDIGPGGEPPSDFQLDEMTSRRASDGTPSIMARVRNTGRRALDLSGSLMLTDGPSAMSAGPFEVTRGTTLGIGDTGMVTVILDKRLPTGPWQAHLTLQSGFVKKEATAAVTFPDPGRTGATVSLVSATWALPAGIGAGVVALVMGTVMVSRRRRTR